MGKLYFTCSFDDGDISDLKLAALLKKYNLKGTFYVPQHCNLTNKSLSECQIRELSDLVEIGGHTMSHQILTDLSFEKASSEIYNCKSWLENITGKQINSFCPPTGRFNKSHILLQKEAGFTSMRTVEMLSSSLNEVEQINEFIILPTTSQVYNHTRTAYLKNLVKRLKFGHYPLFRRLFHLNWEEMSRNYIAHLNEISKRETADYYFHLWGHSWEIEKYSLWNSIERFLKSASEIEGICFCNNSELAEIIRSNKKNGK